MLCFSPPPPPPPVFTEYPSNVNAALDSMVTVVCAADQPVVVWEVNTIQLINEDYMLLFEGIILSVETEMDSASSRTALTFSATEIANTSISVFSCQAGPNIFTLTDGEMLTFSVYGECSPCMRAIPPCLPSPITSLPSYRLHSHTKLVADVAKLYIQKKVQY